MKKIPLEFRKKEYDLKLQSYEQKNNLRKLIGKEISQLLGIDPSDDFELLQIDLTKLKEFQTNYIKVQFAVLPSIEEFTRYAITEIEIAWHSDCIALIRAIQPAKMHLDEYGSFNHTKIVRAFLPMLSFDDSTQKIVPNNEFILS